MPSPEIPEGVEPLSIRDIGGCICLTEGPDGTIVLDVIRNDCAYHRAAAEQPWNHAIPWNCPTYWDGCNCDDPDYGAEDGDGDVPEA